VTGSEPADTQPLRYSARTWLTTILFWGYLALSLPVLFAGALLVFLSSAPFDRRRRALHLYTCFWAYHYVKLLPLWRARFEGLDRIAPGRTYVMVANHQSLGDILVLFGLFRHYKWVSKLAIFRVPFIGWNMRLNDYVALRRGDPESIQQMMEACRRHLRRGSSIMMFPEGTRSLDGEIKAFKHGAFTLARELNLPVLPIVVDGTRDALPKHGLMLEQPAVLRIRVRVLSAHEPGEPTEVEALAETIRRRMLEELAAMRAGNSG
jgi:1-acyl-sn-glycerol-3-phosphate acyltransferase